LRSMYGPRAKGNNSFLGVICFSRMFVDLLTQLA
jgi:hypothetical protein